MLPPPPNQNPRRIPADVFDCHKPSTTLAVYVKRTRSIRAYRVIETTTGDSMPNKSNSALGRVDDIERSAYEKN